MDESNNVESNILETNYEVLGHANKLTYTELFRVLFYSLASLHRQSQRFEAIEMFNDSIGDFKPLWDKTFILNYEAINLEYSNAVDRYRLHRAELTSLLQRSGMMELPDMRYNTVPDWVVPKSLDDFNVDEKELDMAVIKGKYTAYLRSKRTENAEAKKKQKDSRSKAQNCEYNDKLRKMVQEM